MTMGYDLMPFVDRDGGETVWCHVEWTPRHGESRCCSGNYLDLTDGRPRLTCGIFDIADDLGFAEWTLDDGAYCLAISDLVDRQLMREPRATLHCPEGTLEVVLIVPNGGHPGG